MCTLQCTAERIPACRASRLTVCFTLVAAVSCCVLTPVISGGADGMEMTAMVAIKVTAAGVSVGQC